MSGDVDSAVLKRDTEQSGDSDWWLLILLLALIFPVANVVYEVLELVTQTPVTMSRYKYIFYLFVAVGWALTVLSPIAVHFDRKYVATKSKWDPSKLYYLMIIPLFLNVTLAAVYIYKRHKYIGVP